MSMTSLRSFHAPRASRALLLLAASAVTSLVVVSSSCASCDPSPPAPGALPLDVVLGPGEVRCGPVTKESELIGGPGAYAQVGRSFRCMNSRVRFIVQDASRPVGTSVEGGTLIDVDRVRPDESAPGEDTLRELVPALGVQEVHVTSIEVLADGSDGKSATVRVRGVPAPISLAPQAVVLSSNMEGEVVTDYTLHPDTDFIEITTTLFNAGAPLFSVLAGDFLSMGGGTTPHSPEHGFGDVPGFSGVRFLSGARGAAVSYGYVCDGRDVTIPLIDQGVTVPICTDSLPIGSEGGFTRFLIVGDGSLESVARVAWQMRGDVVGHVTGAVAGAPAGTEVSALTGPLDDTRTVVVNEARVADDGTFSLTLPPGSYTLIAHAAGHPRSAPVDVVVSAEADTNAQLAIDAPGTLHVTTTFDDGVARPAKLTVVALDAPLQPSAILGEFDEGGAVHYEVAADGAFATTLPAGNYRIYVTRGFEFTRFEREITIASGSNVDVEAALVRGIDTSGALAGEFHQHTLGSIDSVVPVPTKVLENAAEGIEVAVSTDHDNIVDYQPYVDALGLSDFMLALPGNEVSYQAIGHFNVYPWTIDANDPLRDVGSRIWWMKTIPELFSSVRAMAGDPIVQINHPRSDRTGYFAALQFNPVDGTRGTRAPPTIPTLPSTIYSAWSGDFDAVEVNSGLGDVGLFAASAREQLRTLAIDESTAVPALADWFGLMASGLSVSSMGNSDTHFLNEGVGYPRTYLFIDNDDARTIGEDDVKAAIRTQHAAVAQGCFIDLHVDGARHMGAQDLVSSSSLATLDVRLQAPGHVTPGRIELYVNGIAQPLALDGASLAVTPDGILSVPVPSTSGGGERLRASIAGIDTTVGDLFVVALSRGGTGLAPTGGGEAFCVSPPLYVDVDGDGAWTPPLASTQQVRTRP